MPTALDYSDVLLQPVTQVYRRVDVYNSDGVTPYALNVPILDGSISVDETRQERRTFEGELFNDSGLLNNFPGGFWYDKVIKPYRGAIYNGVTYQTQLGEFVIDKIDTDRGNFSVKISCRDYTKKCLVSVFPQATDFASGQAIETVIKNIALNAGISKFVFPVTGKTTGTIYTFERGTERWKAMTDIATAYNYELYFDNEGYLVLRAQRDPVTSPTIWTFKTGTAGNLVTWSKSANDTRIYNHIVVTGERDGQVPVVGEATNTEPSSPTRIAVLGDRVFQYVSQFITTSAQALDVANSFLKIHALESFDVNLTSIVIPWLEAGDIVEFWDPSPNPGDPIRFLLSSFTIPMKLDSMSVNAKRVTVVK